MKKIVKLIIIGFFSILFLLSACEKDETDEETNTSSRIKQMIEYKDGSPFMKKVFEYTDEKIILMIEYIYSDSNTWGYSKKSEISYPSENEIKIIEYEYDNSWIESSKTEITLLNGYRNEVYLYKFENNIWIPAWTYEYIYLENKITKEISYIHGADSAQKALIIDYFWNGDKAFYKNVFIPDYSNFLLARSDTIFYESYNDTLHLIYDLLANKPVEKMKKIFNGDKIDSEIFLNYFNNNWFEFMNLTYTYNSQGKLVKEDKIYWEVESYTEYSYEVGKGNSYILYRITNWPARFVYPE